jgi:uncharacterized membrane protein YkgB
MNAAMVVGVIGAALVFALDESDSIGPLDAQPLGGVLIGLALILLVGATISASKPNNGDPMSDENVRAITGLVAVVAGIIAIGALTIIAVELLGAEEGGTEATVAITTSAFGIVSTVVAAYLGIKATANAGKTSRVKKEDPPRETREKTGGE